MSPAPAVAFVQSCAGKCVSGTSASATFGSANAAHNAILIYIGWHGAVDSTTLTITDNNHNAWSGATSSAGTGSHVVVGKASTNNCQPNSGAARTTITVTSSQPGDITFVAIEITAGAAYWFPTAFSAQFSGVEAWSQGVGELSVTAHSQVLDGTYAFFGTYQQPPTTSPQSATLIGTFTGSALTLRASEANDNTGNVTIYEQIFASGTGTGVAGGDIVFSSTVAPSADFLTLFLCTAAPTGPTTFNAAQIVATPAAGEYNAAQSVALSCASYGVDIHYTTDGTTPAIGSPIYSAPISVTKLTTIKAYAHDTSGFFTDGLVGSFTFDIFTGQCLNPGNIIDGNDATYCELICAGSTGDVVAVKVQNIPGTTGTAATLVVDFEVVQNNYSGVQTDPAWKVSGFISGTETVLASGAPGAGVVTRGTVSLSIPIGTVAGNISAKITAACEVAGSSGGVDLKIYAAYLSVT